MANPILNQERVAFLNARTRLGETFLAAWSRTNRELPLVEVEVDWVRFSTLNHRTRAEQMREVAMSGDGGLFTSDPMGPKAQDAQLDILRSQEGFEALKSDLKERGQQEPAIVTADGVLINGNRRSAALRSLYRDDNYVKAKYVKCLILPDDASPEELLDLEAELQVARDFKEEYSWINEALLIEELYQREGRDFDRVADRMHRNVNDVRALYDKLQQVHQLVNLSNGAKLHIDFKENESAFDELAKHIKNKPQPEANSVRTVYFLGTLSGVKYRKLRHLRRSDAAAMVLEEVQKESTLQPLLSLVSASRPAALDDPLDAILGEPSGTSLDDVLGFFATKHPKDVVDMGDGQSVLVEELMQTVQGAINLAADEAEEEERDQTAVTAPITRSAKAIEQLERALDALPKARSFKDWDEEAFNAKVGRLQVLVENLGNSS